MELDPLPTEDVLALVRMLWEPESEQDIRRWNEQGFTFQSPDSPFPLGLIQKQGGPCGVLAAVQAELLRSMLFNQTVNTISERKALLHAPMDTKTQQRWLTQALASLLFQCAPDSSTRRIQLIVASPNHSYEQSQLPQYRSYCTIVIYASNAQEIKLLETIEQHIDSFQSFQGVVLFVFSILQTRGRDTIRMDMDDPNTTLTGAFGHCSQELVNLVLTGIACSNVFDGMVPMGDTGLLLRGITCTQSIGYLTQLEALRYCQVGLYYKSPRVPIWVLASTSHFSLCFGMDVIHDSTSQVLYQQIHRVFQAFDPMETGFLEIDNVRASLQQVGIPYEILSNEIMMNRLITKMQVDGAGIVLWDEYWKIVSVLMHTQNIEMALNETTSDEEMARALQAQFDSEQAANRTIELYYYNGFNTTSGSPSLVPFQMFLPPLIEFIGQSIPFEMSTSSQDNVEAILTTKWPNARFNWYGKTPPHVD